MRLSLPHPHFLSLSNTHTLSLSLSITLSLCLLSLCLTLSFFYFSFSFSILLSLSLSLSQHMHTHLLPLSLFLFLFLPLDFPILKSLTDSFISCSLISQKCTRENAFCAAKKVCSTKLAFFSPTKLAEFVFRCVSCCCFVFNLKHFHLHLMFFLQIFLANEIVIETGKQTREY